MEEPRIFGFTINDSEVNCSVSRFSDMGNHGYIVSILFADGVTVTELLQYNAEAQQLEFQIWNTPYREELPELERLLGDAVYKDDL